MMPDVFIDLALRTTVVLGAALLATSALCRAAAATRHLVWTLAVMGVLALPAARAALPEWRVLPAAATRSDSSPNGVTGRLKVGSLSHIAVTDQPREQRRFAGSDRLHFGAWVLPALWAVVAALLLARIAAGIVAVLRLARHARPADARWRALLKRATDDTHTSARIRLLVSRDIAMPMTWGGRRPLLLLPAEALHWSDDRAMVVLLHELAHIRRRDWITHALGHVAAALHWFNPLAWVALRAMTRERERACDDYVLTHGARADDYARHLLDIARAGVSGAAFAVAPAMARPSELEGRLLSIVTSRRRHTARAVRRALALAAVVATAVVAAAAPATTPVAATMASQAPVRLPARPPTNVLLGDIGREEPAEPAVQALAKALADPSPSVRESAALGLALRSGPGVVEPLLGALSDPSAQVREKAAIGLAMRPQRRVVDALLEAMADDDAQVREKVVIALGLSGDARVQDALTAALDDEDAQVREKAAKALTTLPFGDAIRDGIAGALGRFGADIR